MPRPRIGGGLSLACGPRQRRHGLPEPRDGLVAGYAGPALRLDRFDTLTGAAAAIWDAGRPD